VRWSKLKQNIESFFCEKLRERVKLHNTVYHRVRFYYGRAWISVDGKEIYDFNDFANYRISSQIRDQILRTNKTTKNIDDEFYDQINEVSIRAMKGTGIQNKYQFEDDLYEYLRTSAHKALKSNNIVHKSLAIIDRRIGKRTLVSPELSKIRHPLFTTLYKLRLEVEGIDIDKIYKKHK